MNLRALFRPRLKIILLVFTSLATLLIISVASAYFSLGKKMDETLEHRRFLQPTEFFAEGSVFVERGIIHPEQIEVGFKSLSYRQRETDQVILPGDYYRGDHAGCTTRAGATLSDEVAGCFIYVRKDVANDAVAAETTWVLYGNDGLILITAKGQPQNRVHEVALEPVRFAQYLGNEPLMQEHAQLSEIPPMCLNAVLAIEDHAFLEHGGFSVIGILRAVVRNLVSGRRAQGGSTITQQLVKNYFLTSEKKFSRKLQELIMSVELETRFTKDEILETYLNEIYLGQDGAFRVHGYGSASRYYFGRPVSELGLPECALMAAIINNPGALNPWRKPDAARKRRDLVLSKMAEFRMISPEDEATAKKAELPPNTGQALAVETAPYFIDAVRKQIRSQNISLEGIRIYTSLDLPSQQAAQSAIQNHLAKLEATNKTIKARMAAGKRLEGLLLSGDPVTGLIHTAVGGRSFRMTQFNRAVDSRRQVGSIMKPVVMLSAFENSRKDGSKFTPITIVNDEKFSTRYDGQTWSPENFEHKYFGEIPLFFALKNSLNAATASVGLEVGLPNVIATAKQLGIESPLKPLPSLTLGAFELAPREVLGMAMTLASLGAKPQMSFVRRVESLDGKVVFDHDPKVQPAVDPVNASVLVGMMKQVLISGSARSAAANGFILPAAGKTGTTNDSRDTWFMGFTPHLATVVWVGYDDNTPNGLTGSSGSVPVWTDFMKKVATRFPPDDFAWAPGTVKVNLNRAALEGLHAYREQDPDSVDLIFAAGTEPR